jgi:hypothetical protein
MMPDLDPEINGSVVTLRGSFNPVIFQPEWLKSQELLPDGEVTQAEIQIIHPQVCQFKTERFFVQVTPEQFTVGTLPSAAPEPLQDLVLGIFFVLSHVPVTTLGIVRQMHFQLPSDEAWHRLGDKLAPKEIWNDILPGRPGMLTTEISVVMPDAEPGSVINVKVQPSLQITQGAYFEVINHYVAPKKDSLKSCMNILRKDWKERQSNALDIANRVIRWSQQEK